MVSGITELALSFGLGIAVAYVSFRLFARWTKGLDEIGEIKGNHAASGIVLGAMLIASALVVRQAVFPAISTLQTVLFAGGPSARGILVLLGWTLLYVLLAFLSTLLAILAAVRLFLGLTRDIDELAEIRANNVAVAIVLGSVILRERKEKR